MKKAPRFRVVAVIDSGRHRTFGIAVGEQRYLIPPKGTPPLTRRMAAHLALTLNIGPLADLRRR